MGKIVAEPAKGAPRSDRERRGEAGVRHDERSAHLEKGGARLRGVPPRPRVVRWLLMFSTYFVLAVVAVIPVARGAVVWPELGQVGC